MTTPENPAREGWSITESPFRVEHAKAYEGLFTLGSGYLHVRASLEEHLADCPQNAMYDRRPANVTSESFPQTKLKWGAYVPGLYGAHPILGREMVNLPHFLELVPIADGERLDMEQCRISRYQRTLHLDSARVERRLEWHTASGKTIQVAFEWFVHARRPYLVLQRLTLQSDADAELVLQAGIDSDVRTNGYDHFRSVRFTSDGASGIACTVTTDEGTDVRLLTQLFGISGWQYEHAGRQARRTAKLHASAAHAVVAEKRTIIGTTRDCASYRADELMADIAALGFEALHDEHATEWHSRWKQCDIVIDGDADTQVAVRTALFHLLRAHVPHDPRVAIDPKGYAGDAYWGRFFWDTETFLLPFYLYTDPSRARTLVDYRIQSLSGAKRNAKRYGYSGARYAWEADDRGDESCPNWQYADHEVHVTADVVYGLVHYARATGADAFLRGPAAAVLVETARHWLERIDVRPNENTPSLLGVMGPDEYTPISSNNAFTNAMVAFALQAAADHGAAGGASPDERLAFARAAEQLPVLRADDGLLVLQCEEFEHLAEPQFDRLWNDRARTFAAQVSQERLYRSKCLKQADVLMLMMLLPHRFSRDEIRRAWDYYLPYTTHDSSLSAGVHAIVAARLGIRAEAWRFWKIASSIDLDIARGGAAEGVHIANAGAVWQIIVFGFAGLSSAVQTTTLTLDPHLPAEWKGLRFPLIWRDTPALVSLAPQQAAVTNRGERPLSVIVAGLPRMIQPGATQIWTIPPLSAE